MAEKPIKKFIPQVWSARLLEHLDKALVFGGVVNNDYEGEIKNFGDTVYINQISNIKVEDYDYKTGISKTGSVGGNQITLTINQAKYFNFTLDDIDNAQSNPKLMDAAMQRASYSLADVTDKYIAGLYTEAGVKVENNIANANDAYEALVEVACKLDENNVPTYGRFAIVKPAVYAKLLLDERFVKAGTAMTDAIVKTGQVGEAAGFTIYKSNNVPADVNVIAGTRDAICFAEQLTKIESYRVEASFADGVKGLLVFGAKVVQPKALAVVTKVTETVTEGTGA